MSTDRNVNKDKVLPGMEPTSPCDCKDYYVILILAKDFCYCHKAISNNSTKNGNNSRNQLMLFIFSGSGTGIQAQTFVPACNE